MSENATGTPELAALLKAAAEFHALALRLYAEGLPRDAEAFAALWGAGRAVPFITVRLTPLALEVVAGFDCAGEPEIFYTWRPPAPPGGARH